MDPTRFANINGCNVRVSDTSTACKTCGKGQWEIPTAVECVDCIKIKPIRICKNPMMHPNQPGYYLYRNGDQFCSPECRIAPDGTFKIAIHVDGLFVEAPIYWDATTGEQVCREVLQQIWSVKSSPPMIIPPRNSPVDPNSLCFPLDTNPGETNVEFIRRSIGFLDENDTFISMYFKKPCSEMTLAQYISGEELAPTVPVLSEDEIKKWSLIPYGKEDMVLPKDSVLFSHLRPNFPKYTNDQGETMLYLQLVKRSPSLPPPPPPRPLVGGKRPIDPEERLMRWFTKYLELSDITVPALKNRKNRHFKVGEYGVVVASVHGHTYYDKFLYDYACEHPDVISPFLYDRAWVLFKFQSTKERNAWVAHYDQVYEACPMRSFGPLKYLMTSELMKMDENYKKYVECEDTSMPGAGDDHCFMYYEDMVRDYQFLKKRGFSKYDGTFKMPKKPKKKAGAKKRTRKVAPPPESSPIKKKPKAKKVLPPSQDRLIIRLSQEQVRAAQIAAAQKKVEEEEEESFSWDDEHDPYADDEEEED